VPNKKDDDPFVLDAIAKDVRRDDKLALIFDSCGATAVLKICKPICREEDTLADGLSDGLGSFDGKIFQNQA